MVIKLSTLSILLGLGVAAPNLYALLKPSKFAEAARKFPRSIPLGTLFIGLATAWFVFNVRGESIADFESMKPYLYMLFIGVGVGTCLFVKDYLAARGLAVLMLLVAKLMVDTGRPNLGETPWVLLIQTWAYILVVAGIWFTISPHRVRDMIYWNVANEKRLRVLSAIRLTFGLLVVFLGLTVFK
jgi:hypothetical protein